MTRDAMRPTDRQTTLQSRATQLLRSDSGVAVRCLTWLVSPVLNLATVRSSLKRGPKSTRKPPPPAGSVGVDAAGAGTPCLLAANTERQTQLLQQVLGSSLLPSLVSGHCHAPAAWPALEMQVPELTRLVLSACPRAAIALVRQAYAVVGSLVQLLTSLIEPAARRLGDMWHRDDCSEVDVTLGLCHLLTAVRRLEVGRASHTGSSQCVALLAPQPGERHVLCTALHADLAWQAGWEARVEFPATEEDLQALLANRWFDLLDLSLSSAFGREHSVERMATTVALARCASLNSGLIVIVSGWRFQDGNDAAHAVGADSISSSAWHFERLLTLASAAATRERAREMSR